MKKVYKLLGQLSYILSRALVPSIYFRLSVLNIFLIGVVNMYVILTGGLCVIQFSHFRKKELALCLVGISNSPSVCVW